MKTQVTITSAKTIKEVLENQGVITGDSGVIVLKKGRVQHWIVANEITVEARDGQKRLI